MSHLVFLDLETTGLDEKKHQVWEAAYAVDDNDVQSSLLNHSLKNANPVALGINNYSDRIKAWVDTNSGHANRNAWETKLRAVLTGATLVAANPTFDATMLKARWGEAPWAYRMIDLEAYAMPYLGLDRPRGLAYIAEKLGVEAPDHSAHQDVVTLRQCYRILQDKYRIPRG